MNNNKNIIRDLYLQLKKILGIKFVNFLLVGGIGVLLNLALTFLLTEFIFGRHHYLFAFMIGTIVNITYNFIFYSFFTFKKNKVLLQKKILFYVYSLFIVYLQINLVKYIVSFLGVESYLYVIAGVIGFLSIVSFLFFRFFIFNKDPFTKKMIKKDMMYISKFIANIKFSSLYLLISILILAFITRLFIFFNNGLIFWDGSVYIGMGKYFFSGGNIGLYEIFRPPVMALFEGLFWKIGFNPIYAGQIFIFAISMITIYFTYKIGKEIFSEEVGLLAAFFLAISPTFVFYSTKVLNDNLSLFFVVMIFYLILKRWNMFFIGFLTGAAFLTRFPDGIVIPLIMLYLFMGFYTDIKFEYKKIFNADYIRNLILLKKSRQYIIDNIMLILGFFISTFAYFIYNWVKFANPLMGIIEGSKIIQLVGKSISEKWFYYFIHFFYENFLIIFLFVGIFIFIRKRKSHNIKLRHLTYVFLIYILFFLIYLSMLARKEMRYLEIIFPFAYFFAALGIITLLEKVKKHIKIILILIFVCVLIFIDIFAFIIYLNTFDVQPNPILISGFYGKHAQGTVVTSSPLIVAYQDIKPIVIYWTRPGMYKYYENLTPNAYYINDCDLFCLQTDNNCNMGKETFINDLKEYHNMSFEKKLGRCTYYVFN